MSPDYLDGDFPSAIRDKKPPKKKRRVEADTGDYVASILSKGDPKSFSIYPLLHLLERDEDSLPGGFEDLIQDQLPDLREGREQVLNDASELNSQMQRIRPLTKSETFTLLRELRSNSQADASGCLEQLLASKLGLDTRRSSFKIWPPSLRSSPSAALESSDAFTKPQPPNENNPAVNALESILTISYESSFLSRLYGGASSQSDVYLFRDWSARSTWLYLMEDIRSHYAILNPECTDMDASSPTLPIDYQSLQQWHLSQLNDLLIHSFWPGIDVSDSLGQEANQCTVVATYGRLVVGAALLSSPEETYITYLVVRTGWETAQIATKLLYLLISRNPRKDIILHVSANNPAMLLYNRFGFKAEEFIVGFYESYMSANSRGSKNAFRLRLRG